LPLVWAIGSIMLKIPTIPHMIGHLNNRIVHFKLIAQKMGLDWVSSAYFAESQFGLFLVVEILHYLPR